MKEIGLIAAVMMASTIGLVRCFTVSESVDAAQYVEWVEDPGNGLHRSKTLSGYVFDVQYKPAEYVVLKENSEVLPVGDQEVAEQAAQISDMQYFTLRLSREDGVDLLDAGTVDEYSSRLAYFTGLMQSDLSLVEGGDTLPCLLFHFERTYGVDTRSTFLLGFARAKNGVAASKTFVFEDRELGAGPVLLTIDQESITSIPLLKLN